jgi:hypothetical protein
VAVGVFLQTIHIDRPWITAIVPAIAFAISTLAMPYFKKAWVRRMKAHE